MAKCVTARITVVSRALTLDVSSPRLVISFNGLLWLLAQSILQRVRPEFSPFLFFLPLLVKLSMIHRPLPLLPSSHLASSFDVNCCTFDLTDTRHTMLFILCSVPNMLVSRLVLNLRGYRALKDPSTTSLTPNVIETLTTPLPELEFLPHDSGAGYGYESRLWANLGAPLETGIRDDPEEMSVLDSKGERVSEHRAREMGAGEYEAVAVGSPGPGRLGWGARGRGMSTSTVPEVSLCLFSTKKSVVTTADIV